MKPNAQSAPQLWPNTMPMVKDRPKEEPSESFMERVGLTEDGLKKFFAISAEPTVDVTSTSGKLIHLIRSRNKTGRLQSVRDWQTFAAIDEAWNVAYKQTTPTLIGYLLASEKAIGVDELRKQLTAWGISQEQMFTKIKIGDREVERQMGDFTFFNVQIPLVKSVVMARASKI